MLNDYPFKGYFLKKCMAELMLLLWRQQPIITVGPWGKPFTGVLPTMHFGGFRANGAALCHEGGLSPPSNSPHLYFSSPHCLPLYIDTTYLDDE